ncbi:N-acetyltransferase [Hwanghaeella grinnelliae]|uniref:N-acetyltransferase n=2 Tax=Hwanghaeella grinnelliae TaxID=2500179 RepID=A0A3S2VN51_9PROT|nr:N-acetyltransferase [Hwanghaeella grinnelliae]
MKSMTPEDTASCRNRRGPQMDDLTTLPSGVHPGRTALRGDHVVLAPLNPIEHGALLQEAVVDSLTVETSWRFMPLMPSGDEAGTMAWLKQCAGSAEPSFYALLTPEGDEAGGMVSYLNIVPQNGTVELGHIWFRPAWRGSVRTTEAIFLMMVHAFDKLGYRRVEWKCDAMNAPSRAAALRFGFRFEGVFLNHYIIRGRNRDTAWYSITAEEWPAVREAFQTWLEDGNFDEGGGQKTALSTLTRALW